MAKQTAYLRPSALDLSTETVNSCYNLAIMVTVLLALNFLLMIILPLWLSRWIATKRQVGWGLFGMGAVTFILSQVGHLPFNRFVLQQFAWINPENLIIYALFLGVSAGLFEEVARYLTYRFWAKEARSWGQGMMLGAGHGGIEAIVLGVIGLINFVILFGLKNGNFQGILATVPDNQLYLVDAQIEALFGVPASLALLGAVERVFAILLHLSASLLVMQVFVRGQLRWLGAAILWHALIDGVLVYTVSVWGAVPAELVLGGMSLVSVGIIYWLYAPEPTAVPQEPLPALAPLQPLANSPDSLERSKYSG